VGGVAPARDQSYSFSYQTFFTATPFHNLHDLNNNDCAVLGSYLNQQAPY
jgi:hypothetical protein